MKLYELADIDSLSEEKPSEDLEEAAHHIAIEALNDTKFMTTTMGYVLSKLQDIFIAGAEWQKNQMLKDSEEDVLLLERVWLMLDNLGHEELAERLKTFKEKIC